MEAKNLSLKPASHDRLRLVNTQHSMMPNRHADAIEDGFSDIISGNDPRWMLATRVQTALGDPNTIKSFDQTMELVEAGERMGFSEMHARAVIGIVEEAQQRGGLDEIATRQLTRIPKPQSGVELSERARWITFGVLFSWALVIAGLMQLV